MRPILWRCWSVFIAAALAHAVFAQKALTWQQVRAKFEASNPTLRAARSASMNPRRRKSPPTCAPIPDMTAGVDQLDPFTATRTAFGVTFPYVSANYLHERAHKRELRLESAQQGHHRRRLANGRPGAQPALQSAQRLRRRRCRPRRCWRVARENLAYYDHVLAVSSTVSGPATSPAWTWTAWSCSACSSNPTSRPREVNVRTAKIQLLMLLDDRTPVEQFDVTGPFDFSEPLTTLEELRQAALAARPDLLAAVQSVDKARTDYHLAVANGSTDPTFGVDFARNPPIPLYVGFSVNIPLRIFDRNQGEKARTELDIQRNQRLREAAEAQVYQRRGFGLGHAQRQPGAVAAVQGQIPGAGGPRARNHFVLLPARRSFAAGFSERAERLPRPPGHLPEPGGILSRRRRPVESRRGPGGHPVDARRIVESRPNWTARSRQ